MPEIERQNELELVKIWGELKVLSERIEVIKNNDLYHVQKSLDFISKALWGVGFLIFGQLVIAVRLTLWG
jgi:hypothetical protein|tara:strand:+ start:486 stop:695 length:210 start_codon:yes stop_codon:yes gene_type:complete